MAHVRTEEPGKARARDRMVESQIADRGVRDPRLLEAFRRVPRHLFVKSGLEDEAYADRPLPLGFGQTISQPYIVAAMIEAMEIGPQSRVLEIGTGSGYETAILAELVDTVHTIEVIPELAETAQALLTSLGYDNIRYRTGNGAEGWPEEAPFDGIVVSAAPRETPRALLEQLRQGAVCVIPEGGATQVLNRYRRGEGDWTCERLMAVRFVPLI